MMRKNRHTIKIVAAISLLLMLALYPDYAVAGSSPLLKGARQLPPQVDRVWTCGEWSDKGKGGYYRIIKGYFGRSEIYLQWIQVPGGKNMQQAYLDTKVAKTVSVDDFNYGEADWDLDDPECVKTGGKYALRMKGRNFNEEDGEYLITIELGGIGKYKTGFKKVKVKMNDNRSRLLGVWKTDPSDEAGRKEFGNVSLDFSPEGTLVYTIIEEGKDQKIIMTYKVNGDELITDQPSAPREERTRFEFTPDGKLVLHYDGTAAYYIRD